MNTSEGQGVLENLRGHVVGGREVSLFQQSNLFPRGPPLPDDIDFPTLIGPKKACLRYTPMQT